MNRKQTVLAIVLVLCFALSPLAALTFEYNESLSKASDITLGLTLVTPRRTRPDSASIRLRCHRNQLCRDHGERLWDPYRLEASNSQTEAVCPGWNTPSRRCRSCGEL